LDADTGDNCLGYSINVNETCGKPMNKKTLETVFASAATGISSLVRMMLGEL
jgi:hypothetical protein